MSPLVSLLAGVLLAALLPVIAVVAPGTSLLTAAAAAPGPVFVSLVSSDSEFPAGGAVTLTAVVDADLSGTGQRVSIWNLTTGSEIASCTTGTSCSSPPVSWLTGAPHSFQAFVNATAENTSRSNASIASGTVQVSRRPWTLGLTSSAAQVRDGDSFTLTATANQDLSSTGGSFRVVIRDESGGVRGSCVAGTTCTATVAASTGPDVTSYVASVENAAGGDVQATSNPVAVSDKPYIVRLAGALGADTVLTVSLNQPLQSPAAVVLTHPTP